MTQQSFSQVETRPVPDNSGETIQSDAGTSSLSREKIFECKNCDEEYFYDHPDVCDECSCGDFEEVRG